ncbi:Predicted dehydrogenase [Arthrobacter alpinus]|uniref:Predicted dehydrogenase n=1 Tax=Arthrobacter alpinus TaxID=656366 RepID=A0A1H5PHR7_9MICC|nr:Gfo/Idh/MocA family oxidoreductase [Arthrobacter alpinus]SEF13255.1 Predicted dehydrogenase [Arthrobacter alpinus]
MTQKRFRVGIMSFAHPHSGAYIQSLLRRGDVDIWAADPDSLTTLSDEPRGAEMAVQLGVGYVETYTELVGLGLDAVVVCNENTRHREAVELAAAAGLNVLCEKPLATEIEDAKAMIEACRTTGAKLMTAFPIRFSPMFKELQSVVSRGEIGAIVGVTGANIGKVPTGPHSWFIDPALAGGGSLIDLAVHVVDLLDVLLDQDEPAKIYAVTNEILHADKPEVITETGALVNIKYANGVVATIDSSWSQADSAPNWGALTLQVVGTHGIAEIDTSVQHLGGYDQIGNQEFWLDFGPSAIDELVDEFLSSIVEDRQPQPSAEVGLRTLRIVKAAQESAASGETVLSSP